MACENTSNTNTPKTRSNSDLNYVVIIVLYILLAIILGAVIF